MNKTYASFGKIALVNLCFSMFLYSCTFSTNFDTTQRDTSNVMREIDNLRREAMRNNTMDPFSRNNRDSIFRELNRLIANNPNLANNRDFNAENIFREFNNIFDQSQNLFNNTFDDNFFNDANITETQNSDGSSTRTITQSVDGLGMSASFRKTTTVIPASTTTTIITNPRNNNSQEVSHINPTSTRTTRTTVTTTTTSSSSSSSSSWSTSNSFSNNN